MKFNFKLGTLDEHPGGYFLMLLKIPLSERSVIDKLKSLLDGEDLKSCEIAKFKKKRSLDANAALWRLCNEIAIASQNSKDNIYTIMVKTYGIWDDIIIKSELSDEFIRRWDEGSSAHFSQGYSLCDKVEEWSKNGVKWTQLRCYHGTSSYNTQQFSTLLQGVIDEAKTLGIDFISKEEMASMMEAWERKRDG